MKKIEMRYEKNVPRILFLLILFVFNFIGCRNVKEGAQTEIIFNTVCSVNLFEDASAELYAEIFSRLRQIENTFNNYSPSSEISFVNENAAETPVKISDDFFLVLKTALDFCELSGGEFDITVGPLVKLWNVTGENPHIPSKEEFERTLPLVNYKNVILSNANREGEITFAKTVQFAKNGVQLDLGAIAKGFAADEVEKILARKKVRRAIVSLGGNVYVHGKKSRSEKWRVAIQNPFGEGVAATLCVQDTSVVTSGGYERFFKKDGVRYSHILNPKTGFPVQTNIASVTIITPNSIAADALSTSIFVCGIERVAAFQKSEACANFDCVVILQDGTNYATRGLEGDLILQNDASVVWF